MKTFFINLVFIIIGYLLLSLANMALVMLFFYESPAIQIALVVLCQAVIIFPLSGSYTFLLMARLKTVGLPSVFILAGLLITVSGLNVYLGLSLEPAWYVISNLLFTLVGLGVGYWYRSERRAQQQ